MLSDEEKINLLKIEGKRLVQVYESADVKKNMFDFCPVCAEAERLKINPNISRCRICYQLGVGKRCRQFLHLSDGFIGLACLLNPDYLYKEEKEAKKKIKELILEVKAELDEILDEEKGR